MKRYCAFCLSYFTNANQPILLGGPISHEARELIRTITDGAADSWMLVVGRTSYNRKFLMERGEFPTVAAWIDFMERWGDGFFYHSMMGDPVYPVAVTTVDGYDVCTMHIPNNLNMHQTVGRRH